MYAVIKTGGKQHKVKAGDVIEVEKLVTADETITFTPLLVVEDDGTTHAGPAASKAKVTAKPVGRDQGRQGQDLQVPAEDRVTLKPWLGTASSSTPDRDPRRGSLG